MLWENKTWDMAIAEYNDNRAMIKTNKQGYYDLMINGVLLMRGYNQFYMKQQASYIMLNQGTK